jgi:hypothetical protein
MPAWTSSSVSNAYSPKLISPAQNQTEIFSAKTPGNQVAGIKSLMALWLHAFALKISVS